MSLTKSSVTPQHSPARVSRSSIDCLAKQCVVQNKPPNSIAWLAFTGSLSNSASYVKTEESRRTEPACCRQPESLPRCIKLNCDHSISKQQQITYTTQRTSSRSCFVLIRSTRCTKR